MFEPFRSDISIGDTRQYISLKFTFKILYMWGIYLSYGIQSITCILELPGEPKSELFGTEKYNREEMNYILNTELLKPVLPWM